MEVGIKKFGVEAWVQTKGIEFEVRTPEDTHLGDLVLDRRGLVWCRGRTGKRGGVRVTWREFIEWMEEK